MRAYPVTKFGVDDLQQIEVPDLQPTPGTVLIKLHAVSLNHRDLMVVKGLYNPRMALPRIPCSDGAGEIVAIGDGVTRVKVGDRVCGIFMQRWTDGQPTAENVKTALGGDTDGVLADYALLHQDGVVLLPEYLTYEEAATLPCAGVTAWNALQHAGDSTRPIQPGETVLIQGTGGVSLFALQFARILGAKVIGISSSDAKLSRAQTLGLNAGANYKQHPDWSRWVTEITNGEGVDRVIEVGGLSTLGQSLRAVRLGGTIAQIGVLGNGAATEPIPLRLLLHKQIRIHGVYVGSRTMFEQMNAAIESVKLHPVIDRIFDFDHAQQAFRYMESASHFGKIVIRVNHP